MISGISTADPFVPQTAQVAAEHGAVAACRFWAFDRASFPNGRPAGFQSDWDNGTPQVQQALAALNAPELRAKAIAIGDSHKVKLPCCCCLPPAFTPGSTEATLNEMQTGFINEAANATGHGIELVVRSFANGGENGGYRDFLILLLVPPTAAVAAGPSLIQMDVE
jgi:hypothetical protein